MPPRTFSSPTSPPPLTHLPSSPVRPWEGKWDRRMGPASRRQNGAEELRQDVRSKCAAGEKTRQVEKEQQKRGTCQVPTPPKGPLCAVRVGGQSGPTRPLLASPLPQSSRRRCTPQRLPTIGSQTHPTVAGINLFTPTSFPSICGVLLLKKTKLKNKVLAHPQAPSPFNLGFIIYMCLLPCSERFPGTCSVLHERSV